MTTTEKCDGCVWYWPDGVKCRCSNVTMVNRGGWHPLPEHRCEEYQSAKAKKQNPAQIREERRKQCFIISHIPAARILI